MLGLYLSILLSPRIMSFCRQGRFYSLYRILQRIFIIGALGIYLFFYLYVDVVARMLFPPSFASSKGIFMILLPAALSWLVTTPLVMTFVMFIRPKFIVVMESIIFPFLLFSYAWAISLHGAMGAAWVTLGFGLLRSGILQLAAWRWARRLPATGEGNWMAAEEPVIPPNLS
jgi:O-antigen/teichoic acid export membrane protein